MRPRSLLERDGKMWVEPPIRAALVRAPKDGNRFWRIDGFQWGEQGESKVATDLSIIASTSPDSASTNVMLFGPRADADAYHDAILSMEEGPIPPVPHASIEFTMGPVREAVRDYTGVDVAPAVIVSDGARPARLSDAQCLELAAVVFALAELVVHPDRSSQVTVFADGDVTLSTRLDVRVNRLVPPGRDFLGVYGWWG